MITKKHIDYLSKVDKTLKKIIKNTFNLDDALIFYSNPYSDHEPS